MQIQAKLASMTKTLKDKSSIDKENQIRTDIDEIYELSFHPEKYGENGFLFVGGFLHDEIKHLKLGNIYTIHID